MTRKQPPSGYAMFGAQAKSAAQQAIPAAVNATNAAAQQAVPLAKNAGQSVKQGTDDAIAWATPYADAARAWMAPRLEQSAAAVSENLAPLISDALITAARKIDKRPAQARRRRRFGNAGLLAASLLLIAAGAATALSMRRRDDDDGYQAMDPAAGPGPDSARIVAAEQDEQDWIDPDANGHPNLG